MHHIITPQCYLENSRSHTRDLPLTAAPALNELVPTETECGGAGVSYGYVATLAECAAITAPHSIVFVYGTNRNGKRLQQSGVQIFVRGARNDFMLSRETYWVQLVEKA